MTVVSFLRKTWPKRDAPFFTKQTEHGLVVAVVTVLGRAAPARHDVIVIRYDAPVLRIREPLGDEGHAFEALAHRHISDGHIPLLNPKP